MADIKTKDNAKGTIRMTTVCAPTVPWQGSKKSVGKQGCCIWKMPGTGAAMTIG